MKSLFVFGPLVFLVSIACVIAQTSSAQREKTYVAIDDIGVRVEVVGRLSVPLRKMTYFKATWIQSPDRSKPESIPLRLKIMEIDRVSVERDILFLPTDVVFVNIAGKEVVAHELTGVIDLFG